MPALQGDPLRMSLALPVLLVLVGAPALVLAAVWLRLRFKEKHRDAYLDAVRRDLESSGVESLGGGMFRRGARAGKVEASTNPLFGRGFTVRVSAWSGTIHEVELQRGRAVPAEFDPFRPLLDRWESAGKMFTECYAAGVTEDPHVAGTFSSLLELSTLPVSKAYRGGTFTYREGFERDVPQWHWRHDQRPRLPKEVRRACFSYWQDGPLLNPIIMRVLWDLAGGNRKFFITHVRNLNFLEYGFEPQGVERHGSLIELLHPDMPVAADLLTDGEFFSGMLVGRTIPAGFESDQLPRYRFHDVAAQTMPRCDFYARRLYDDEFSWFSGEYEIVSAGPLDLRGTVLKVAAEIGAQVMEIDRRFHKRIVVPLNY